VSCLLIKCCRNMQNLYVLRFPHKNNVRFVFTSCCLYEGSCLIYVSCVFLRIVLLCFCLIFFRLCCQFWLSLRVDCIFKWKGSSELKMWVLIWNIHLILSFSLFYFNFFRNILAEFVLSHFLTLLFFRKVSINVIYQ
jgi:hypothetical protein